MKIELNLQEVRLAIHQYIMNKNNWDELTSKIQIVMAQP